MTSDTVDPSHNDVENVIGAALFAVGRGARGLWINLAAVQFLRRRFRPRVAAAVEAPDWRDRWRDEQPYLLAQAEAMGRHAARLAKEEDRLCITSADLEMAMAKLRGSLPVAGRWCPF
jgi:hypothetical protein